MPVEITPITATNPVVTEAVAAKTFDTWFLTDFRLVSNQNREFDAESFWRLGRYKEDGTPEFTDKVVVSRVANLLSDENITLHPEIANVTPGFLGALEAIAKRQGVI